MNYIYSLIKLSKTGATPRSMKWLGSVYFIGISGVCNLLFAFTPMSLGTIFKLSTVLGVMIPLVYLIYPGYKIRPEMTQYSENRLILLSLGIGLIVFLVYMLSIYILLLVR